MSLNSDLEISSIVIQLRGAMVWIKWDNLCKEFGKVSSVLEMFKKAILIPKSYSILNIPSMCCPRQVGSDSRCFICDSSRRIHFSCPWEIQVNILIAKTYGNRNFWAGERNQGTCRSVSFSAPVTDQFSEARRLLPLPLPSPLLSPSHIQWLPITKSVDNCTACLISLLMTSETFDYLYLFNSFCSFGFCNSSFFCFTSCPPVATF